VGAGTSSDPIFTAPLGENAWAAGSPTPPLSADEPNEIPVQASLETPLSPQTTPTAENEADPGEAAAPTPPLTEATPILYYTQAGDSLPVVAARFGVQPAEITSPDPLPETAFLPPNQLLLIPHRLSNTTSPRHLLPDSEVVYSPSTTDFDIGAYVSQAGGYLASYTEYLKSTGTTRGADVVARVALENSINPRLLLSLLEYQSGWVFGQPANLAQSEYPLGWIELDKRGLYKQLVLAVKHLSNGYYGWREGRLTEITFSDGVTARLAPDLNAGTVALQYYYAQLFDTQTWLRAIDPLEGLPALHERMFGSPWVRALNVEPLYPSGLTQPELILPFLPNQTWSFSGGPHGPWEDNGARAALDFAPGSVESGCVKSDAWVVASASGLVVRSGNAIVVLDLDGDGYEQTGWVVFYLHIESKGRILKDTWVEAGDKLGHPSCEGGQATGTHVHIARKYNGEWLPADGPIPFNLNGWIAHAGQRIYEGTLTREDRIIYASVFGSFESQIRRETP
jgi:LysM repeat protein